MNLKYGKLAPVAHADTRPMDKLLAMALPPPEQKRAWEYGVSDSLWALTMLGNDQVGDCVIAAIMHWIMAACAACGRSIPIFKTQDAFDLYSAITGYKQGDPSTDNGTAWTAALAYWKNTGVTLPDGTVHKILDWGSFDYSDPVKLNQAIDIFGGALIGTKVTASMEQQFGSCQSWDGPFNGPLEGLHGIPILGYGRQGRDAISWARRVFNDLTFPTIWDEAYVVVTPDFLTSLQKTPKLGIDLNTLETYMKEIAA